MKEIDQDTRITCNFTWREFLRSRTAKRLGIYNTIYEGSVEEASAKSLFVRVIQPVRDIVGPIWVTSGYRCPELNRAVGGVTSSQHQKAEAADLASAQMSPFALAQAFIDAGVEFDQLILEHDQGVVHVSHCCGHNRGEVLTRYMDGRILSYKAGLVDEDDL